MYNPVSGRGKSYRHAGAIAERLLQIPCDVELMQTQTTSPELWLAPKLQCNPDAIVVVGGDGTLRQVASVVKETSIPLYHSACGTENLFAKSMALDAHPDAVARAIIQNTTKKIDTALANNNFMLLMASVGFDASVVEDLARHRGSSITHLSYVLPFVRQLLRWNVPTVSIEVDGNALILAKKGWCVVANSKAYARGLNPARNANIADGKLDVVFLPLRGRWSLWKWIRLMKHGTHLHHPDVAYAQGKKITVQTTKSTPWQIDGDSAGEQENMMLCCVPNSLTVFTS